MRHLVRWSEKLRAFGHGYQVSAIGGTSANGCDWSASEAEAIAAIQSGSKAYFIVKNGAVCDLAVGRAGSITYLKTRTDIEAPESLLALPDFGCGSRAEGRGALVA
jgi:hypothetical protein